MPWKESYRMDERIKFIGHLLDGEKMSELCKKFGISRKTGYKFLQRFKSSGPEGLLDQKRGPRNVPHKTPTEIENLVIKVRKRKPSWGPKKIAARLRVLYPEVKIPASSTIGEILDREGFIESRKRKNRFLCAREPLFATSARPNAIWCIDFKGQFRMSNGNYCYPLTISDHYSRFLIGCEALPNTKFEESQLVLERAFKRFGLPEKIISDNGSPFASNGLYRLSKLSAWFIQLGVRPEYIQPGHPEQNGRHERMHLTLKKETTRPAGKNLLHQQEKFDRFQKEYNEERPHEALEMKTPASFYSDSCRKYPEELPSADYSTCDSIRRIVSSGSLILPTKKADRVYFTRALAGHQIGLREIEQNKWKAYFFEMDLGTVERMEDKYILKTVT